MVRRCWYNSKEKELNFRGGIWYQRCVGCYIAPDSRNSEMHLEEGSS